VAKPMCFTHSYMAPHKRKRLIDFLEVGDVPVATDRRYGRHPLS
jgi:hypothetical protein